MCTCSATASVQPSPRRSPTSPQPLRVWSIACGSTRKPGEMMQDQARHVLAQPNISQEERKEALRVFKESREQLEHLPADDNQFVMGNACVLLAVVLRLRCCR